MPKPSSKDLEYAHIHINSFNEALSENGYINSFLKNTPATELYLDRDKKIFLKIKYKHLKLEKKTCKSTLPFEHRFKRTTYSSDSHLNLILTISKENEILLTEEISTFSGKLPLMLGSNCCLLNSASKETRIKAKEDPYEEGGFFIVDGKEMVLRNLLVNKSNEPICIRRPRFSQTGKLYTDFGVTFKSIGYENLDLAFNNFHFLKNYMITISFRASYNFYIPFVLVLKCLSQKTDYEIYKDIQNVLLPHKQHSQNNKTNNSDKNGGNRLNNEESFYILMEQNLLYNSNIECVSNDFDNKKYKNFVNANTKDNSNGNSVHEEFIGCIEAQSKYRLPILTELRSCKENVEFILENLLLINCPSFEQKYSTIIHLIAKLISFKDGLIFEDNLDVLSNLELVSSGTAYFRVLIYCLNLRLRGFQRRIFKEFSTSPFSSSISTTSNNKSNKSKDEGEREKKECLLESKEIMRKLKEMLDLDFSRLLKAFLNTGNLITNVSGLPNQTSGFTVSLERNNSVQSISTLTAVHRGQHFLRIKSTEVRKLRPETWGFLCPVNTPDGGSCGLLLSLTAGAFTGEQISPLKLVLEQLTKLVNYKNNKESSGKSLPIFMNWIYITDININKIEELENKLRELKRDKSELFEHLEIVIITSKNIIGRTEGIFLSLNPYTIKRKVYNIQLNFNEIISPSEQTFLRIDLPTHYNNHFNQSSISSNNKEITHKEINLKQLFSLGPSWTPFAGCNPSTRNMYQITMLKQSLNIPSLAYNYSTTVKAFALSHLQEPIVKNIESANSGYLQKELGTGINCIVAVASYTGFDMEDAIVVNKQAIERKLFHASYIRTEIIDLERPERHFHNLKNGELNNPFLDLDGLPRIGQRLKEGDAYYSYMDADMGSIKVVNYKKKESAIIQEVIPIVEERNIITKVIIKLRSSRTPIVGDKFSSRHGQKGTVSLLWPQESLPFSRQGIVPDVIINPHAFPKRMTVGMLIESLAGKLGCTLGEVQESSPFRMYENKFAADYYREALGKIGFCESGEETMHCGMSGKEMKGKVFIGVVYYQRLKQMVLDKSQVRGTGKINCLTRQPVKGKKEGGGLRFGEMERDSILAHGASFFLKERLMNVSDYFSTNICVNCGSFFALEYNNETDEDDEWKNIRRVGCKRCGKEEKIEKVSIPFASYYLMNELESVGIRTELKF